MKYSPVAKNELITPETYKPDSYFNEIAGRVYGRYNAVLRANNALDFDDLLMETVLLLQRSDAVRERMQDRYLHVLVDEFQDTNIAQYTLVRLLSGKHHNLFCVGDPDQCLPAGTLVSTAHGQVPIERIHSGSQVTAASGHGRATSMAVTCIRRRATNEDLVCVTTRSGRVVRATAGHIFFARLGEHLDAQPVFLLQDARHGYRIGLSEDIRSDGTRPASHGQIGWTMPTGQASVVKAWVIRTCETRADALDWANVYSAVYCIPATLTARDAGRPALPALPSRLAMTAHPAVPLRERVAQLMESLQIDPRYPHYLSQTRAQPVVMVHMFGDRQRTSASWHAHLLTLQGGDETLRPVASHLGQTVAADRPVLRPTMRQVDLPRRDMGEAIQAADVFVKAGLELVMDACLVRPDSAKPTERFGFMPASHLHPGMIVAASEGGGIVTDEIIAVGREPYGGEVFDLDVEHGHNYIAGGIVVHNSIYKWRGADHRNVQRLREDFKDLQTIALDQNYRSTQTILDAAMAVIKRNPNRTHIDLFTKRGHGPKIAVREMFNEDEEAQYVVDTLAELMHQNAAEPGEVAVMYRMNAQSRAVEDAFVRAGLPYRLVGATRFYGRKEIKDVLAYLRIVNNPADTVSFQRIINVPPRGAGEKTFAQIEGAARASSITCLDVLTQGNLGGRGAKALKEFGTLWTQWVRLRSELSVDQLFDHIIQTSGYRDYVRDGTEEGEDRWANVQELKNVAAEAGDMPLADFLSDVALVSEVDNYDENANAPTLMTLHAAKGLEFKVVFIVGLVEGVLPHSRSLDDPEEMAEERRLMYVGITRAKDRLYLLRPFRRSQWGMSDVAEPSRFLRDLPDEAVDGKPKKNSDVVKDVTSWAGGATSRAKRQPDKPASSDTKFKPGDRVTHPKFGEGMVLRSTRVRDDEEVEVFFSGAGGKRLSAELSGLKKVER